MATDAVVKSSYGYYYVYPRLYPRLRPCEHTSQYAELSITSTRRQTAAGISKHRVAFRHGSLLYAGTSKRGQGRSVLSNKAASGREHSSISGASLTP